MLETVLIRNDYSVQYSFSTQYDKSTETNSVQSQQRGCYKAQKRIKLLFLLFSIGY